MCTVIAFHGLFQFCLLLLKYMNVFSVSTTCFSTVAGILDTALSFALLFELLCGHEIYT